MSWLRVQGDQTNSGTLVISDSPEACLNHIGIALGRDEAWECSAGRDIELSSFWVHGEVGDSLVLVYFLEE